MKKLLSCTAFLLCLVILTGLFPVILAEGTNDPVHILACSDFQAPNGNDEGRLQVNAILSAMKKDGITKADGLFACGDYDYDFTDTEGGIKMLSQTLSSFVKTNKIFVQGNHDSANAAVGTKGLAESGNNDPAHGKYGAFVINEEDYMWYNDDETTVMRTAQKLIEYLNEKLTSGFDKPIFVLSHLGLHYTMRTAKEGDGKYAHYLFDVLNEAGKKGLNIVFLYGHNHSNGWDDYLGGPAVFLHKGDKMYVGQGSNTAKRSETLHFTYLNAGYTGYYSNVNGQDDALTMTYITVDGGEVSFVRYDKNGVHNMKSAGVTNAYQGESGYKPNTTVYTSPQSITLTALSDRTPIENLLTIDKTLPVWKKILSADELKDGCRYLLVRNGSQDSIMLPTVVTKAYTDGSERIGFDLYDTEDFGDKLAFAAVDDAEWLFTKAQGGWLIGDGYSYLTRQQTENQGIAAIFTEEGHVLQIKGENGSFNIYNGSFYSFNYNKRHLINFYTSDPAFFYLYEAVGYLVTVESGTSSLPYAKAGESLTLTASDAPEGYLFDSWTVTNGSLTLDDPTKETVTFTMPDGAVTLKANYKPLPVTNAPITTDTPVTDAPQDDTPDRNSTVLIVLIVIGAIALVGITAAVTVIVMKKKAK